MNDVMARRVLVTSCSLQYLKLWR